MIDIGCYIEAAIEWLTEEGAVFFADMGYGILGGNHANACLSAFLHLHGFADRNPTRHLGGKK